jgi:hypothetical protein
MFFNFKCTDVDQVNRVQDDLQIVCWDPAHSLFSFFVAFPSIVVWGLGIPLFAFFLLSKVRNSLDKTETRETYGFLYRGYKKQFYYWEIIIMYRKIFLICIAVFVESAGVIAQALIVFILLIGFLIVNLKKKPFATVALNDLETLSLVTSTITVYCGIFFISNMPQTWILDNPGISQGAISLSDNLVLFFFGIIVLVNFLFFVYWMI